MATHKRPRIDPLTMEVVELIGTVVARYHEEYEDAAAEHALTGAQARLLSLLSLEPLPMRRLAQKLRCDRRIGCQVSKHRRVPCASCAACRPRLQQHGGRS